MELDLLEESDRRKKKNTKRMKGKRRRLSVRMKMAKIKSGYEPLYIFMSIYIYMHMLIQYFVWGYTKIIVIYVIIRVCVPYGVGLT